MRLVLPAALAAFAMLAAPVSAAPFETLNAPGGVGGGSNVASGLGIDLTVVGNNVSIPAGAVTGFADAFVSLDGANNGTAGINSSDLTLANTSGNINIPFVLNINFAFVGVKVDVQFSETVTGGAFTISSATTGQLNLSDGQVQLVGTALGSNVNSAIDLSTDPIGLNFADLGAATINGTADDSLAGDDTTAPGEEITLDWAGATTVFNVEVSGTTIPIVVALTGSGLSIGQVVPEPTSGLFLASMLAGAGAVARRRRS